MDETVKQGLDDLLIQEQRDHKVNKEGIANLLKKSNMAFTVGQSESIQDKISHWFD